MANLPTKAKNYTKWEQKDKDRAMRVYRSLGNIHKTSEITGIHYDTIRYWMKQDFWKEGMLALKAEDTAELEDAATSIAKKANELILERLANGDYILGKDGQLMRKPVSARDAIVVAGISLEKRKMLQEEPIREQQLGTAERLLKLVEQFARLGSAKEVKSIVKEAAQLESKPIIEGEAEEVDAELPELQEELQAGSSDGIETEAGVPEGEESSPEGHDKSGPSGTE